MSMQRLPKSIQAQADAAEAILAQGTPPAATEVQPAPIELPPPAPAEPVPPAPEPTPPAPREPKSDYWEQRAKTLLGMIDSQAKTHGQQLKELQRELQALKEKPVVTEVVKPAIDPKDVDAFGADMIEMVNKQAERVYSALSKQFSDTFTALDGRLKSIEQQFTGVTEQTAAQREDTFFAALTARVPDWESINEDPQWLEWLDVTDPIYGVKRQAALDHARQSFDAERAAGVFRAFKSSRPAPKQKETLRSQVTPSTTGSGTIPEPTAAKPIITQQQIHQFYNEVAHGRWRGREAEMKATEALINEALAEGRVR